MRVRISTFCLLLGLAPTHGCSQHRPAARGAVADGDGCFMDLKFHQHTLTKALSADLDLLANARRLVEAQFMARRFLQDARTQGVTGPEISCQLKAGIYASRLDVVRQDELWSYFNAPLVIARSCSNRDYQRAVQHLADLRTLAEVRGDINRQHALRSNAAMLEEIHAAVVHHQLCPTDGPSAPVSQSTLSGVSR